MVMPVSMGKGRRLFSKDSLIHKAKFMGMKGAAIGGKGGYIAAASYGKVRGLITAQGFVWFEKLACCTPSALSTVLTQLCLQLLQLPCAVYLLVRR
jgi:hypothetical protein